jgi:TP901 family phage tail tape measure protein
MAVAAEALLRLRSQFDGRGLDAARKAFGQLEREAKGVRGSLKDVVSSASWQGAAGAATGIGAGLAYSAKKAIELETQMVQVRKVVDFSGHNGLKNMTADIVELSTKVPYAAKELAEIAAAAGMAGYAEKDIMKFVNAASQMGTAFNMSAKDAGDAMVAFQAGMGLTLDEAISMGDAINHLSDNLKGVVEPAALVEVTKRIGAIGKASGLSAEQVAALGAAFLAPGTASEVAATGVKNFLKALTIGDAGSESFHAAFKKLGLDAQQVAKDMQTDALPTIKDVLTRIAALPKELQAGVITKIFGEESKAAIMPLLTNLNLVDEAFGLVADKSQYAGSMQKEFNNQLNSTEAQLKLFKNNLDAVAISLGNALLPGINAILGALRPVISAIGFLSQKIPGFSALIVGLGVAFAGLVISAPFISSVITLAGALSRLGILATIAGWLGAVGPWLSRLAPWLLQIGSVVTRIGPLLSSIVPILLGVGRVLLGIFTGPVGWATLLISAGIALYAFRDRIMQFFTWLAPSWNTYVVTPLRTLWTTFTTWVGSTFSTLGPKLAAGFAGLAIAFRSYVVIPIQTIWGTFLNWIRTSLATSAVGWWKSVTGGFNLYVVQPIQYAFSALLSWIGQAITRLRTWFATIWTGIAQGFQTWAIIPIQNAWGMFAQWFSRTASNLGTLFAQMWASVSRAFVAYVTQPVQQGWSSLSQWLSQGVGNLRQVLAGAWNGVSMSFNSSVVQPFRQGWGGVLGWMKGAATTAARGVASAFSSVSSAIRSNMIEPLQRSFQAFVGWVRNTINGLIGWLNGVQARIQALISRVGGGGSPGGAGPLKFAKGGYVNGPTLAWVGEGKDPGEYIIPSGKMYQASMNFLAGKRGASVLQSANNIRGFASGGYVSSGAATGNRRRGRRTPLNTGGTGFTGYGSKKFINMMMKKNNPMYDERASRVGGTNINGKWYYWDSKNAAQEIAQAYLRAGIRDITFTIPNGGLGSIAKTINNKPRRYAKGGFVKRPTLGLIGEGRDSEYIIPSGKMAASSMAYLSGARGMGVIDPPRFANGGVVGSSSNRSASLDSILQRTGDLRGASVVVEAPTINATIEIKTGDVVEFQGEQYVSMADYQRGLREVQNRTMALLRTAQGRRATGR